jgi:hypothetical protein
MGVRHAVAPAARHRLQRQVRPGGLVHFYSFIVRARAGFRAERFMDRRLRPMAAEGFWAAFFKGGQLADDGTRDLARRPAPRASEPARG